jgi:hypothetical protein
VPSGFFQFGKNNDVSGRPAEAPISFNFKPFSGFNVTNISNENVLPVKPLPALQKEPQQSSAPFSFAKPFVRRVKSPERLLNAVKTRHRAGTLANDSFVFEKPRAIVVKQKRAGPSSTSNTTTNSLTSDSITKYFTAPQFPVQNYSNTVQTQPPSQQNHSHVVIVEQPPFSLFKSLKSQEQAESVCY